MSGEVVGKVPRVKQDLARGRFRVGETVLTNLVDERGCVLLRRETVAQKLFLDEQPIDLPASEADVFIVFVSFDETIIVMMAIVMQKMHRHMGDVLWDEQRSPFGVVDVIHPVNKAPSLVMVSAKIGLRDEHGGGPRPKVD